MEYVCIYSFTSKKRDQNEVGGGTSTDEIVSHLRPPELENEKRPWNEVVRPQSLCFLVTLSKSCRSIYVYIYMYIYIMLESRVFCFF